jgi:hypothetical protein
VKFYYDDPFLECVRQLRAQVCNDCRDIKILSRLKSKSGSPVDTTYPLQLSLGLAAENISDLLRSLLSINMTGILLASRYVGR